MCSRLSEISVSFVVSNPSKLILPLKHSHLEPSLDQLSGCLNARWAASNYLRLDGNEVFLRFCPSNTLFLSLDFSLTHKTFG